MNAPLWKHYFEFLTEDPSTSSPWGIDGARVKELLAELYRLGERPSSEEVADYLATLYTPEGLGPHQKALLKLWNERLKYPHRRWRGSSGWSYPFVVADRYVSENGGDSTATRLARVLAAAAADYAAVIDRAPHTGDAETAAEELRHAHHALATWGLVLDRVGEDWHGSSCLPAPLSPAYRRNPFTTRGKERYDAWLARIAAEWDAQAQREE